MKRVLSLVLTLSMALSLLCITPAYAAETPSTAPTGVITGVEDEVTFVDFSKFTDIGNHWASSQLEWAVSNGLLAGTSETTMSPDGYITRGEMATIIVRAFGATKSADISMFVDITSDDWCYDAIAKAVQMGCLSGFGNSIAYNDQVTRKEIAMTLVKAAGYPLQNSSLVNRFSDANQIDDWAKSYLATAISNGLLTGYTDGRCGPQDKVTRAQFAVMMQRMASAFMTPTAVYTEKNVNGSLMVGVGNISLDNMVVTGNLFLTDGVGTGDITLNGTIVNGTVFVRGTGPDTVKLQNGSRVKDVVLCNPNNAVTLEIDDTSRVTGTTYVSEANGSVTITGDVGPVYIQTAKAPVKFNNATADDVYITAKLAAVSIDKNSTVGDVNISSEAAGVELEVVGVASGLSIDGANSTVDISGTADSIAVGGADSKIDVSGKLSSLSFSDAGSESELTLASGCKIDDLQIDSDDLTLKLDGELTNVTITGDDCDIEFGGATIISRIDVDGHRNEVTFASGSDVKRVYSTGDELKFDGQGSVEKFQVDDGDDILVTVPKAQLYNKDGTKVFGGDDDVVRGETVTINDAGTSTVEADEAKKQEEEENNNNQGNNGNNQGGSGNNGNNQGGSGNSGNNGGTGNGGDSGGTDPIEVTMTAAMPVDALPSDFGQGSAYTFSSFGEGLSFDATSGELTGTVKFIEEFLWYSTTGNQPHATGYYVPLVLQPTISSTAGVLTVGEATFDYNVISTGVKYNGRWMAYLALNPDAEDKTITVKFDPDGTGSAFGEASLEVDYSAVVFDGLNGDEGSELTNIVGAPGMDGAETPTVTLGVVDGDTYNYTMTTEALLEHMNSGGRYGYWAGIRIPAPEGATSVDVSVKSPVDDFGENARYTVATDGTEELARYVDIYLEADVKGIWEIRLTWMNNEDTLEGYNTSFINVDTTGCKLAGEGGSSELTPIATGMSISAASDSDISAYGSLSDFVYNYKVVGESVRGSLFEYAGGGGLSKGTYLPLKLTVDTPVAGATVEVEGTAIPGAVISTGTAEAILMVPVTLRGNYVEDFRITLVPDDDAAYSSISLTIDASALSAGASNMILFKEEAPAGTDTYITDASYSVFSGMLTVEGTMKSVDASTASGLGITVSDDVWVAPVTVTVKSAEPDYTVKVETPVEVTWQSSIFSGGETTIYVPVAYDGAAYNSVTLSLCDSGGELLATGSIYFNGTFEGFEIGSEVPVEPEV